MTHRAAEIIAAVAADLRVRVGPSGKKVFEHRRSSLDAEQDELPAYSVDFGDDPPADQQPLKGINSELNVVVTAVAVAPTEGELRALLLGMREHADERLYDAMHGNRLGLTFVYGIGYGGATAPEIEAVEGEKPVGSLSCTWVFGYRLR